MLKGAELKGLYRYVVDPSSEVVIYLVIAVNEGIANGVETDLPYLPVIGYGKISASELAKGVKDGLPLTGTDDLKGKIVFSVKRQIYIKLATWYT